MRNGTIRRFRVQGFILFASGAGLGPNQETLRGVQAGLNEDFCPLINDVYGGLSKLWSLFGSLL